jgi:hypothetical protein
MAASPGTDKVDAVAVELCLDRIPRLCNEKELEAAADDIDWVERRPLR